MNELMSIPGETDWVTLLVIAGLTLVTIVSRSFFFISARPMPNPRWFQRSLQYAPVAALAAVVAPEILLSNGHLAGWADARLYGAAVGAAWYFYRRSVMGTILMGMAVYLPLHLALGW